MMNKDSLTLLGVTCGFILLGSLCFQYDINAIGIGFWLVAISVAIYGLCSHLADSVTVRR